MYAVIETGGKQYRVQAGDVLAIDRVTAAASEAIQFDKVLTVVDGDKVQVGAPLVKNATVNAEVVEHFRGPKLVVFKMKRRKGSHVMHGHRQELSRVRIVDITSGK
jgi:large subunit ribosomal protein L21